MIFSRVKIITTAPLNEADNIREALGKAGALRRAHPYEERIVDIIPLINEEYL